MRGLIVMLLLLSVGLWTSVGAGQSAAPAWLRQPQTFGMLPLVPEEAQEMGISVNGIWAGFGGGHPILTFPPFVKRVGEAFGEDADAFVRANHEAGMQVVCGINGIEGMQLVRAGIENWEALSCRNADGEKVLWGNPEEQCYVMCTNNPDWVAWEIDYGKRGIDLGADVVLIDTPQGQAIANLFVRAGFCSACMNTFHAYLAKRYTEDELKTRFGLETWDNAAVVQRLRMPVAAPDEAMTYTKRIEREPLFAEYLHCMEAASFETRKTLVEALRDHAKSKNRRIALSTNAFNLGTNNPFGYWVRGLMFADLVDFFAYENSHCPAGLPFQEEPLPRGKWAAYHRLAYAVKGVRSAAVVGAGALGKTYFPMLASGKTVNAWMGVLAAEAYAANGAYIMYYFDAPANARQSMWASSEAVARFVRGHEELYTGALRSGSSVAVLVLANDRGRSIPGVYPSYLGFLQAFTEGNYPVDVLFAGDDQFMKDQLSAGDLKPYDTLIVPSPIDPTPRQQRILREFLAAGGRLVCQEPERMGIDSTLEPTSMPGLRGEAKRGSGVLSVLGGEVTPTSMDDAASRYFAEAQAADRSAIFGIAESLGLKSLLPDRQDGTIAAFPIAQPESHRYVVHLVNYDVDPDADEVRPVETLRVAPALPANFGTVKSVELHLPESATPQALEFAADGTVHIPRIGLHATLVIQAAG
ncbi:MAG: hypothetical protein HYV27_22040 [Candidatus Hydrogenedentes bacterium]|nr:hypothetical protein [Candidatus Hydrogenedentota bacterium]